MAKTPQVFPLSGGTNLKTTVFTTSPDATRNEHVIKCDNVVPALVYSPMTD